MASIDSCVLEVSASWPTRDNRKDWLRRMVSLFPVTSKQAKCFLETVWRRFSKSTHHIMQLEVVGRICKGWKTTAAPFPILASRRSGSQPHPVHADTLPHSLKATTILMQKLLCGPLSRVYERWLIPAGYRSISKDEKFPFTRQISLSGHSSVKTAGRTNISQFLHEARAHAQVLHKYSISSNGSLFFSVSSWLL